MNKLRDPDESATPAEHTWSGDVSLGVAAWAGAARRAGPDRPRSGAGKPPPDPMAEGEEADAEAFARRILLDALTDRARSRDELAARLKKKDVPGDLAHKLLDRFTEVGLIDDAAFARDWIEARQRSRGLATRALAQELRRKGVDDQIARDALAEVDPASEEQSARLLVRKRLRSLTRVEPEVAKRRLAGMLARKGYSSSLAFRVIGEELADARESEHAGDEDPGQVPDFAGEY